MQATRPLIFAAAILMLLISACSQAPKGLTPPFLEPQFGSAEDDIGVDVAFVSTGRIYSLAKEFGYDYEEGSNYGKVLLRRFDGSGDLVWTREIIVRNCSEDYNNCQSINARSLEANSQGYTFALYSVPYDGAMDCAYTVSSRVSKVDATGREVSSIYLGQNGTSYGGNLGVAFKDAISMTVDGSGNIYAARQKADFSDDYCSATRSNVVAKHSPSGTLLWQRASTVGTPYGITVSSSGSVYVVGDKGLARYTNSGNLSWTKPGNFEEVIVSGSNLYTRYRKDIRKYDGTGKQLWLRTQSGLSTIVLQAMDGDGNGNVYLSGKYQASTGNMNAMTRKLNAKGSVLWTKTYGTSKYDDARGIATITGSEIYTTGETQGSLAHTNIGGRDGYLRKQNSTGGLVWTR